MADSKTATGIRVVVALVTIQTAILLAGIPWAYTMHGCMVRVQTTLTAIANDHDTIHTLTERVLWLEITAGKDTSSK